MRIIYYFMLIVVVLVSSWGVFAQEVSNPLGFSTGTNASVFVTPVANESMVQPSIATIYRCEGSFGTSSLSALSSLECTIKQGMVLLGIEALLNVILLLTIALVIAAQMSNDKAVSYGLLAAIAIVVIIKFVLNRQS